MTVVTEIHHQKYTHKQTDRVPDLAACPECAGSLGRDDRHAEVTCQQCGLVVEEGLIDQGPEWRGGDAQERAARARTGSPLTEALHDRGLSTVIGYSMKDASGRSVRAENLPALRRMRRLHHRTSMATGASLGVGATRNLAIAIAEILRLGSALGVPRPISEQAIRLYRQAAQKDLIRGRSVESIATACLSLASRMAGVPRDADQVASVSRVDRRTLLRTQQKLVQELGLKPPQVRAHDFVPRFASKLGLAPDVEQHAKAILTRAEETGVGSGRAPASLAATALYLSSRELGTPRTQREVSEVTGVTEVTVRTRMRELQPLVEQASAASQN
ncbi:MAG TPA: TFIIB-type zinc ribbon-containing protein [Candidatus Thermoplasmatota archaeon]|nr:TFIIB-type zinc ribbon-containing protein [Candidatus Thermoplasmatota archaeon]